VGVNEDRSARIPRQLATRPVHDTDHIHRPETDGQTDAAPRADAVEGKKLQRAGESRYPRPASGRHERDRLTVVVPDHPPALTPGAARALLKVLLEAAKALNDRDRDDGRSSA
jgi:hypothetical protein